jgi:hypothetical protein
MKLIYTGNDFCYYLMEVVNFFVFLSGLSLLFSCIYLYITLQNFNSFIFLLLTISLLLLFTSTYGFFLVKNAPTSLLIYQCLLFSLTIFVVILAFFLIFDKDRIIHFLISNLKDSYEAIEETKILVNKNLEITRMGMFVYACLLVIYYSLY